MFPSKKLLLTFLFVAGACAAVFGQTVDQDRSVIYRKSASPVRGKLLTYQQGVRAVVETDAGEVVEIPDKDIERIRQGEEGNQETAPRKKSRYREALSQPKGWYNATFLTFLPGQSGRNTLLLGAGVANVTGYRFRRLSLGIGLGADVYDRREEAVYPVFGECRAYLSPAERGAWYLNVSGGYGFARKRSQADITAAQGGFHIRPGIGFQGHAKDGMAWHAETGLRMQPATFTRERFNGDVEIRELLFRRLAFTVGLSLVRNQGGR
ncbi:MAG: hypothetical protein RLY31_1651 [Bacteroidota bacterium]|jgi:hypothetical protein